MKFSVDDLDAFVAKTDELGGPNAKLTKEYWTEFTYSPAVKINQDLDPYSVDYLNQQIDLYRELSRREVDPNANELTTFEMDHHVHAPNPYGVRDPSNLALHFIRLSHAVARAQLPPSPRVLDMGAGWGLSSEFFAMLGSRVTAVDINPAFVELITRRKAHHGNDVTAVVGNFDAFEPDEQYDAVFFYECLHHAMTPWELIARARRWLAPGGKIVFAGEPVNSFWWRHWGLRLDPLSVYCTRKFGWFESGWSKEFIIGCFHRAGMSVDFSESSYPDAGPVCVASRMALGETISPRALIGFIDFEGINLDGNYLVATGEGAATITKPEGVSFIDFHIVNFRPRPIRIDTSVEGEGAYAVNAAPGETIVSCKLAWPVTKLHFASETWIPAKEIGNQDNRTLSFHIAGARFS